MNPLITNTKGDGNEENNSGKVRLVHWREKSANEQRLFVIRETITIEKLSGFDYKRAVAEMQQPFRKMDKF